MRIRYLGGALAALLFMLPVAARADTRAGGSIAGNFDLSVTAGPNSRVVGVVSTGSVVVAFGDPLLLGKYQQNITPTESDSLTYGFGQYQLNGGPLMPGIIVVAIVIDQATGQARASVQVFDLNNNLIFGEGGPFLTGGASIN